MGTIFVMENPNLDKIMGSMQGYEQLGADAGSWAGHYFGGVSKKAGVARGVRVFYECIEQQDQQVISQLGYGSLTGKIVIAPDPFLGEQGRQEEQRITREIALQIRRDSGFAVAVEGLYSANPTAWEY